MKVNKNGQGVHLFTILRHFSIDIRACVTKFVFKYKYEVRYRSEVVLCDQCRRLTTAHNIAAPRFEFC